MHLTALTVEEEAKSINAVKEVEITFVFRRYRLVILAFEALTYFETQTVFGGHEGFARIVVSFF